MSVLLSLLIFTVKRQEEIKILSQYQFLQTTNKAFAASKGFLTFSDMSWVPTMAKNCEMKVVFT